MNERRKWAMVWIGLILIQFLPIITTKNFNYSIMGNFSLAGNILANNSLQYLKQFYLVFKMIPVLLVILMLCKKKVTRLYLIYLGCLYIVFALVQNIGQVDGYGIGFVTPNIIMCIMMSIMWFYEAYHCKEEYQFKRKPFPYYLLIPLCVLAFWDPPIDHTLSGIPMRFTAYNFVFSFAGMAESMMTGILITIYLFTHDNLTGKAFKLLCIVGVFRGVENMGLVALYINSDRGAAIAWLITHLPLLIISVVGYILICRYKTKNVNDRDKCYDSTEIS